MKNKRIKYLIIFLVIFQLIGPFGYLIYKLFPNSLKVWFLNLTNNQQITIAISIMVAFLFFSNYGIHRYYKNKQNKILARFQNENYEFFENLKMEQTWASGFRLNRAKLIIAQNYMIVFVSNSIFNGKIQQAGLPIGLYFADNQIQNLEYTTQNMKISHWTPTHDGVMLTLEAFNLIQRYPLRFHFKLDPNQKAKVSAFLSQNEPN